MIARPRSPIAAALALLVCSPAHAHGMFTGFSGFWNGVFHVFISPEQVIGIFALGCAIARLGTSALQRPLLAHMLALPAGALAGLYALPPELEATRALPLLFAGIILIDPGEKTAAFPKLSIAAAAFAAGIACGAGVPPSDTRLTFAAGTLLGAVAVTGFALAGWERFYRPQLRIATRIAGSWMAAIGVLLLGAALR
jgi:hydrogenase/urease accessory protein HupE